MHCEEKSSNYILKESKRDENYVKLNLYNNSKEGLEILIDQSGIVDEIEVNNYKVQFKEGKLFTINDMDSKGNIKSFITLFNESGKQIARSSFHDGLENGPSITYSENGYDSLYYIEYRNGKKHGVYKEFFHGNKIKIKGYYKNDIKTALWVSYDSLGNIISKTNY